MRPSVSLQQETVLEDWEIRVGNYSQTFIDGAFGRVMENPSNEIKWNRTEMTLLLSSAQLHLKSDSQCMEETLKKNNQPMLLLCTCVGELFFVALRLVIAAAEMLVLVLLLVLDLIVLYHLPDGSSSNTGCPG